jgi:hypothetical protein
MSRQRHGHGTHHPPPGGPSRWAGRAAPGGGPGPRRAAGHGLYMSVHDHPGLPDVSNLAIAVAFLERVLSVADEIRVRLGGLRVVSLRSRELWRSECAAGRLGGPCARVTALARHRPYYRSPSRRRRPGGPPGLRPQWAARRLMARLETQRMALAAAMRAANLHALLLLRQLSHFWAFGASRGHSPSFNFGCQCR